MLSLGKFIAALSGTLPMTKIRFLYKILPNFYCVVGKITTRSLARTGGISARTWFRFLSMKSIDWTLLRIKYFLSFILPNWNKDDVCIVAVDETVEGKSRNNTYGIGKVYSSIQNKVIQGVAFMALSVINVRTRTSYSIAVEQVVQTEEDRKRIEAEKKKKALAKESSEKGKRGRKPGTKNKTKEEKEKEQDNANFRTFKKLLQSALSSIKSVLGGVGIKVVYLVADSKFSPLHYLKFAETQGMKLISKLNSNVVLTEVIEVKEQNKGKSKAKSKKKGKKMDLKNLPEDFLKQEGLDQSGKFYEKVYNFKAQNPSMGDEILNVVIIVRRSTKDDKESHVILFSNDIDLSYELIIEYYSLRFQIEFDFRDAKQFFGLSSFKNYKKENVTNFVNMIFFMVLVNRNLLEKFRIDLKIPELNTNDLKHILTLRHMAEEIINKVRKDPNLIYSDTFIDTLVPENMIAWRA